MFYRTYLFTPGNRGDRFLKGVDAAPDAIVLDLEDGVGLAEKAQARKNIADFFAQQSQYQGVDFGIRLNAFDTQEILKDLQMLIDTQIKPCFLILAKTQSPHELCLLAQWLPDIPLMATVETLSALQIAESIASAHPRVQALGLGIADLSSELGVDPANSTAMLYAKSRIVASAKQAGIAAVDGPSLVFEGDALQQEVLANVAQGFNGKIVIHPKQVNTVNQAWAPTPEQVDFAKRALAALDAAGGNAVQVDGKMVDKALINRLQNVLAMGT